VTWPRPPHCGVAHALSIVGVLIRLGVPAFDTAAPTRLPLGTQFMVALVLVKASAMVPRSITGRRFDRLVGDMAGLSEHVGKSPDARLALRGVTSPTKTTLSEGRECLGA